MLCCSTIKDLLTDEHSREIRLTLLWGKQTAKFNPRVEMWLYDIVTILFYIIIILI